MTGLKTHHIAGLVSVFFLTGCVSTKKLDATAFHQLRGRTICAATLQPESHLTIIKASQGAGIALGGAVGGAINATANEGNLDEKYGVQDPAIQISQSLTKQLTTKCGAIEQPALTLQSKKMSNQQIANSCPSDYVLCTQTTAWIFSYFPFRWGRYRPTLAAHVRLLNGTTGEVIAETKSSQLSQLDADSAPSLVGLFENNGDGLKTHLKKAAGQLTQKISQNIF